MHNNYYFISHLSKAIAQKLHCPWSLSFNDKRNPPDTQTMELAECFSQDKDELVLGFCNTSEEFYIRAVLGQSFASLSFPPDFQRAKKNTVDLFSELIGRKVWKVIQFLNERSFCICLEEDYFLLFKMHGNRSNILFFQGVEAKGSFHKRMEKDKQIRLTTFDRPLEQNFETFAKMNYQWVTLFPTFGGEIKSYLESRGIEKMDEKAKWDLIQDTLRLLEKPLYSVLLHQGEPLLTLLPPAKDDLLLFEGSNSLQASNEFYVAYHKISLLEQEKTGALKILHRKLKHIQGYLLKTEQKMQELEANSGNQQTADLIMANLHLIEKNSSSVELFDFYTQKMRTIKLKKDLSAQKNAEWYYKKAKNEKMEMVILQKNLRNKEEEMNEILRHIQQVERIDQLRELRKYLQSNALLPNEPGKQTQDHLFRKFTFKGYEIWVGKNAKNNDLLTQKYAYKEDLWLHAKDVGGSHVIIKYKAGQKFPSDVIEKAASLAAYYSKRSKDSLCPVAYTPKKYVRKTKDLAAGQVIIEKEEVILVIPESF